MSNEIKLEIKAIGSDDKPKGYFKAYGNTFDVVDNVGDVSLQGCFDATIAEHKAAGTFPRLLSQHGHESNPIGIITSMTVDAKGLLFEGVFCLETKDGADAYALCKQGAIDTFSIGYIARKFKHVGEHRHLVDLDVKEISLVTFPANDESKLLEVKSESITEKQESAKMEDVTKTETPTEVKASAPATLEKKAIGNSWYSVQTLTTKVISINCVYDILSMLPPTALIEIIAAAETGRQEQLIALGLGADGEKVEAKADTAETETKAADTVADDKETKAEDADTDAETKAEDVEVDADNDAETKAEDADAETKAEDEDTDAETKAEDEEVPAVEKKSINVAEWLI